MKKISYYLVSFLALAMTVVACTKKEEPVPTPTPGGDGFKLNEVVAAAADAYSTWEDAREIPASVTVAGQTLNASDFFFVEATALVEISEGKSDDIAVTSYKAAASPDKDSYDKTEIAVVNGPKDGKGVAEDIVTIAKTFLADAAAKGQWQNRALVYRGEDALAFCTNRAIVTVMRALATYAETSKLEGTISTEYLSASNTLKAFAQEFVKYLPIWEATVADKLSADGSHCTANNSAWERVHFIPIPYDTDNDYHNEGKDQYDFAKYGNPVNIEVNGVTYTAANCWEIAIRGLMDMCTTDGQAFLNTMDRNTPINYGDGLSLMSAPISKPSDACVWGKYPWYESSNDGGFIKYNDETLTEMGVDLLLKACSWHVVRSFIKNNFNDPLGMIGNFQQFGTDPSKTLVTEGYEGLISPMREFLILARIYKHLLDNNINKNVYTAIKDVKFDADLYNQQLPVDVKTKSLKFEATPEGPLTIELTATESWTAACDADWITLDKTSGAAGDATISVTAQNYTESEDRTATITISAGDYSKDVAVTQKAYVAPTAATIKDFAVEYVKLIDIWESTVGTVNMLKGEGAQGDEFDVENAHYIPESTTITVNGSVFNLADVMELGQRSYLLLRGYDGNWTEKSGAAAYEDHKLAGSTMDTELPITHSYKWGASPYNETGSTSAGNVVTGNGGHLKMGDPNVCDGVDLVKLNILDNFAFRSTNYPINNVTISNMCGYAGGQLAGYYGCFCAKRALLTYAYFFKYMLDNSLADATGISADQTFKTDLFGEGTPVTTDPTIKDFAKEYVKLLDVWEKTTGKINTITGFDTESGNYNPDNDVIGHYIPEDTKITVGKKEYNLADVYELAERSFLLLRGFDGNDEDPTHYGAGKVATIPEAATMSTELPKTHEYKWADLRYNESAGNGGNFMKNDGSAVASLAVLENNAQRSMNWPLSKGTISNNCGYPRDPITGFKGCFSAARALLTYAEFFKYMLDNSLETASQLSADLEVPTRLFGETKPVPATNPTIKDFATEYVKLLDVWEKTTGNVEMYTDIIYEGVNYIPSDATITVGDKTLNISQALEVAMRSYMLLIGIDGNDATTVGADKFSAVTPATMSAEMPADHNYGINWWYMETKGNGGPIRYKGEANKVTVAMLKNYSERNVNFANGNGGKWGNTAGYTDRLPDFSGCFIPGRCQMAFLRLFKELLDNKVESGIPEYFEGKTIDCTLWNKPDYD